MACKLHVPKTKISCGGMREQNTMSQRPHPETHTVFLYILFLILCWFTPNKWGHTVCDNTKGKKAWFCLKSSQVHGHHFFLGNDAVEWKIFALCSLLTPQLNFLFHLEVTKKPFTWTPSWPFSILHFLDKITLFFISFHVKLWTFSYEAKLLFSSVLLVGEWISTQRSEV